MATQKRLYFSSDYMEGALPEIINRLSETNLEHTSGYGTDAYCALARKKILTACQCPEGEVHFLVGGTQTNAAVIGSLLRPYQGVISADTGHIAVHEAGAIEAGGHKVLTIPNVNGKLTAASVLQYLKSFYADGSYEHMVIPGMVYISHPTEQGTLYTQKELEELREVCQKYNLPLYLDGARLAYALACPSNELTLPILAQNCQVFYIGGTKCGCLFGEAVVFTQKDLIPGFFSMTKQHGALFAKGRLLGLQFDTLFSDALYTRAAMQAIACADRIRNALVEYGYTFFIDSPTNQIFIIMENEKLNSFGHYVEYGFWENFDETHTVIRLATSWATTDEDTRQLILLLKDFA